MCPLYDNYMPVLIQWCAPQLLLGIPPTRVSGSSCLEIDDRQSDTLCFFIFICSPTTSRSKIDHSSSHHR